MPEIYKVNARGERVADDDPSAAYVINPSDSGSAALLERLQGGGNEATALVVDGIKAAVPKHGQASERHRDAAERIRRIRDENRRTREDAEAKRLGTYSDPGGTVSGGDTESVPLPEDEVETNTAKRRKR